MRLTCVFSDFMVDKISGDGVYLSKYFKNAQNDGLKGGQKDGYDYW